MKPQLEFCAFNVNIVLYCSLCYLLFLFSNLRKFVDTCSVSIAIHSRIESGKKGFAVKVILAFSFLKDTAVLFLLWDRRWGEGRC